MSQSVAGRVMPMITVRSVDDIRNFYVDRLGFSHVMGMVGKDGHLDFCTVVMGEARIMFMRAPGESTTSANKQPVEIYLEVEDVDALHKRFTKSGVAISDALTMQWWGIGLSKCWIRTAMKSGSTPTSLNQHRRKGRNSFEPTGREHDVMRIADAFLEELNLEAATTRRVLERVPEAHLAWQPHPKSMSLRQLAMHVATLPRLVSQFLGTDRLDFDSVPTEPPTSVSHADLLAAFASSTDQARSYLVNLSDDRARATWRLVAGERHLLAAPRTAILRSLLFNHWYHHRGQLVVYLRLLDVPVPSVYGPTADENPFAVV